MGTQGISVSVDDRAGEPFAYIVMIGHDLFSLNVWVRREEVPLFAGVQKADWDARGSIQIGVAAGAPAFWSTKGESVSVVVGHDDETWDFAVELPLASFRKIVAELERYSGERLRPA